MIPIYEEIMLPLLKYLLDGEERSLGQTHDDLATQFKLTDEELREFLPSGQQTIFRNRVSWARTYMKKAGLIISTRRSHFQISNRGVELLEENPTEINSKFLARYESFVEFKSPRKSTIGLKNDDTDQTLEESLEYTYQQLHSELAKELLDLIKTCTPSFFESLVIDLLITMGYGGSREDAGKAMGKSGDGGIDEIINEDRLGLDVIYLQAKRWDNTVPLKEIRDFTGALASKQAKKGIFITGSFIYDIVYKIGMNIYSRF